jgi:hypothetical protein
METAFRTNSVTGLAPPRLGTEWPLVTWLLGLPHVGDDDIAFDQRVVEPSAAKPGARRADPAQILRARNAECFSKAQP